MNTGFVASTITRMIERKKKITFNIISLILILGSCLIAFLWVAVPDGKIASILGAIALLFIIGMQKIYRRKLSKAVENPLECNEIANLKRYEPLQKTIEQIDKEMVLCIGKVGTFVTDHWIVSALSASLNAMRLEDVVWIYKHVEQTKISVNYLPVSRSTSYSAYVWDRHGHYLEIPGSDEGINTVMNEIIKKVPWITHGYFELYAEAWMSRRTDFISAVDNRRMEMTHDAAVRVLENKTSEKSNKHSANGNQMKIIENQTNPLSQIKLNESDIQVLADHIQKKKDKSARAKGIFILIIGLCTSSIFILPFVDAIAEGQAKISFSSDGIIISVILVLTGVFQILFGEKALRFMTNMIYRNKWTLILFMISMVGFFIVVTKFINWLLELQGYGLTS